MTESLYVIGLISGGKDSFYNILHCMHHGHRIVALANLYPADGTDATVRCIDPNDEVAPGKGLHEGAGDMPTTDLNSFMYQTVGHEIIPLYASATGIPLYRQPIMGAASHQERDYDYSREEHTLQTQGEQGLEETESMVPLLNRIKSHHPQANAVCAGAILSTYQRTRVESVALRLGLTPLAYLWKYPVLPSPTPKIDDAQLLRDMALAGMDARIIKVASAGLDEDFLWKRASSTEGANAIKKSLRKYGTGNGAALGEGGEFETIVVDGPSHLFRKKISLPSEGRKNVREGGGTAWLATRGAKLEDKSTDEQTILREPSIWDDVFQALLLDVSSKTISGLSIPASSKGLATSTVRDLLLENQATLCQETFIASATSDSVPIQRETGDIASQIRKYLLSRKATAADITNTVVILRHMADFPNVNTVYGQLFDKVNPPSRVTISSGDLLPSKCRIMISIALPSKPRDSDRAGLHIQSRSYWAPANIGPYSQAIQTRLLGVQSPEPRALTVAGQIPLVPATMVLPSLGDSHLSQSVVLSLQHLWRIGVEMGVQLWTSSVAYFSRANSADEMSNRARLAGYCWKRIHAQKGEEEETETGPDLWDLKYNPEYMTLNDQGQHQALPLPDFDIFSLRQQNEPDSCIPAMFSVEVEDLPRSSLVEWHAHLGLSHLGQGQAETIQLDLEPGIRAWHVVVKCPWAVSIHTAIEGASKDDTVSWQHLKEVLGKGFNASMKGFSLGTAQELQEAKPYLMYTHGLPRDYDHRDSALIPCHSIWSATGQRRAWVGLWRRTFSLAK